MRRGFDVSNWTGAPDASWDALNQGEPGVLFVQAIDPPAGYPTGVTAQQIQWGLDNGWDVVAYLWKWFSLGLEDTSRKLDLLEPFTGRLLALANDVEDTSVGVVAAAGSVPTVAMPAEALARFKRQPPPHANMAAAVGLPLQARLDQLAALWQLTDSYPTILGAQLGGTIYYGGRWYHLPYLGNTTMLAERGCRLWPAQYDGVFDLSAVTLFGGFTSDAVIAKQPQGTITVGGLGNVDPDICADTLARPFGPPAPTEDPAWVAKKPKVVQLAGELLAVADQLEESADSAEVVRELADGVRSRAGEILA
jgi:hypothetical protein